MRKYERIRIDTGKECYICGRRFTANDQVEFKSVGKKILVYCAGHSHRNSDSSDKASMTA